MTEKSVSTLGRIASVLGVASKNSKETTPIESILRMQRFQIWGFILMILAVVTIIWIIQKKLDSIDKQYKEQFILLHRLFKSHQDLQVKVHKNNNNNSSGNNNNNNNNNNSGNNNNNNNNGGNNNNNQQPIVNDTNVFVPPVINERVILQTIKEEPVEDDTSSIASVATVETVETIQSDKIVEQKVVEVDDSLPDMFN